MKEHCIKVNLNDVLFNINCNNESDYKHIKYVFDKMLSSDYYAKSSSNTINNIYYSSDVCEYNNISSQLLNVKSNSIKPNILEYDLDVIKIYHHFSGFYVFEKDNNYYIISNNNKYAPYYLILELYSKICEKSNYYMFHGNGIKIEDISFDIIGYSHSGKTTLMSKLFNMDNYNKSFLSNDRILIGKDQTFYFPIDLNLDAKTILNDNHLNKHLISSGYVSPNKFVNMYDNLSYISKSDNNCILVPHIDLKNAKNLDVYPMNLNSVRDILTYCCFSIEDKECLRENWIMKSFDIKQLDKEISLLINHITNYYKIIYVNYGYATEGEEIYERIRKKI